MRFESKHRILKIILTYSSSYANILKSIAIRYQRRRGRRRYLGASSREGAISARAAKKALSRRELRRRRYLGVNSKKALSQAGFFFLQFCSGSPTRPHVSRGEW